MKRRYSPTRRTFRSDGKGISKATALLILFVLSFVEFIVFVKMLRYGSIHSVSIVTFCLWFCNWGFIIGLLGYVLSHKATQANGYMEVSNYINLNKLGKDK
jgi:hypothetical protein